MAHEHARQMVDSQEGGSRVIVMFVGGVLLINSVLALWLFDQPFYSQAMAFAAAILLGTPLVVQAFRDLLSGHSHMDELAALAVVAAFAMGEYLESGIVAFFVVLTTIIEHKTAMGARKSIESLVRLTPTRAHRKQEDGSEVEVEARDLRPGDIVVVRPGDNIPGDGVVIEGLSTVNQANITGESLPVDKNNGDEVFGGTINMTGRLEIRVTKAGNDTTLGRVKDLIIQAERTRIPALKLIDRYAGWYMPVVLMLALITFVFRRDPDAAIGMLVVACPCAFILASPTAMVAALSAAARLGVLVKNVADLEVARNLTAIVFDKTGTLTTGLLSVTKLTPAQGVSGAELLQVAADAERNSRHPVAKAVVEVARKARVAEGRVEAFTEVPGRGVQAVIEGRRILVGRENWIREQGVDLSGLDTSSAEGLSLLYVARDGQALGWVGLEDKTRPNAARAIDDLRELGIKKQVMVTGDRWSVARRVAAEMHCTDVQAEVLPAQKLELVDALKAQGHTVAVVGDGVNDAPALAAGDISVAMGAAGSDVAIHSASIALMNSNLSRLPFLVRLSRRTFSVVRQNLVFAVFYVLVVMTLLNLGFFGKHAIIWSAVLHLVSSFVVIFNSARLVREGESIEDAEAAEGPARPAPATVSVARPSMA